MLLAPDCRCYLINLNRSPNRLDARHARLDVAAHQTALREYAREQMNARYEAVSRQLAWLVN